MSVTPRVVPQLSCHQFESVSPEYHHAHWMHADVPGPPVQAHLPYRSFGGVPPPPPPRSYSHRMSTETNNIGSAYQQPRRIIPVIETLETQLNRELHRRRRFSHGDVVAPTVVSPTLFRARRSEFNEAIRMRAIRMELAASSTPPSESPRNIALGLQAARQLPSATTSSPLVSRNSSVSNITIDSDMNVSSSNSSISRNSSMSSTTSSWGFSDNTLDPGARTTSVSELIHRFETRSSAWRTITDHRASREDVTPDNIADTERGSAEHDVI